MTHFDISIAVRHCRDNNGNMRPALIDKVQTPYSVNIALRKLSFSLHFPVDKHLLKVRYIFRLNKSYYDLVTDLSCKAQA